MSKEFIQFCEQNGIHQELITSYTPEQNGVAKRKNRTVVEMARRMLKAKELSNEYQGEAIVTSVYLLNLSPITAVLNQTHFKPWTYIKPLVSHLRKFDCIAYALINLHAHKKLDEKAERCIFIGFFSHSKAYRLYNPLSRKILIRRDAMFDEVANYNKKQHNRDNYILIFKDQEHSPVITT